MIIKNSSKIVFMQEKYTILNSSELILLYLSNLFALI